MKFLLIFLWLFMRNHWTCLIIKRKILKGILFYLLFFILGEIAVYEILKISLGGEGKGVLLILSFNHLRDILLSWYHILWDLRNSIVMLWLVIFTQWSILYTIRPTVVKSVEVETINQRRNSDTDSNDNFNSHGVIIDDWEELEAISYKKLIKFFNINLKTLLLYKVYS